MGSVVIAMSLPLYPNKRAQLPIVQYAGCHRAGLDKCRGLLPHTRIRTVDHPAHNKCYTNFTILALSYPLYKLYKHTRTSKYTEISTAISI
jgi:hypothetical protein